MSEKYTKVLGTEAVYIDTSAGLQDTRKIMFRRHARYCAAHPDLEIRLGQNTFLEINAHKLYDIVSALVCAGSLEGVSLVKGDIASYSSAELRNMAELAELTENKPDEKTTD